MLQSETFCTIFTSVYYSEFCCNERQTKQGDLFIRYSLCGQLFMNDPVINFLDINTSVSKHASSETKQLWRKQSFMIL